MRICKAPIPARHQYLTQTSNCGPIVPRALSLMVWGRESVKGSFDRVTLNETVANGRDAVELSVFQSGEGSGWVYEALTQTLDGGRLSALFGSTVGFVVYERALSL